MYRLFTYITFFTLSIMSAYGNNISISNLSYIENTDESYLNISFDIAWENSWRVSGSDPYNWDAAWVFMKYSEDNGATWHHLNMTDNWATDGYYWDYEMGLVDPKLTYDVVSNPNVGLFLYRSDHKIGSGDFSCSDIKLRWYFKNQGLEDGANIIIRAYAIEMVYVPEGAYYLGSGGEEEDDTKDLEVSEYYDKTGAFYTYNAADLDSHEPFQITSEGEIAVGATTGALYYPKAPSGSSGDQKGPIPAEFPKGFKAFYCMKYETSQGQYADFLNSITATQYTNHYKDKSAYRYTISGTYGNVTASSPDRACNYVLWPNICALLDWAALRPMTELEFEKACRGTEIPVANALAWGTTNFISTTILTNDGTINETPSDGNCHVYNGLLQGPFRVGCYATASTDREASGASYYGIMEFSGNLWERSVSVGHSKGRAYEGSHGDGELSTNGNANNTDWPGYTSSTDGVSSPYGAGLRGGAFTQEIYRARISNRYYAAFTSDNQHNENKRGIRGVRTAQ